MIVHAEPVVRIDPEDQDRFLAMLPSIRRYAQLAFRSYRSEAREDAIAEVVANAYAAYVRLIERGKADVAFATPMASFAVRQYLAGRRVGSCFTVCDVMSRAAQRRHGFRVERLNVLNRDGGDWLDAVADDTSTPVPDQAAFRCDFPAWLRRQQRRNRRIAEALALGHTTAQMARRFRVSPARISQLRAEFHTSWQAFHGESAC